MREIRWLAFRDQDYAQWVSFLLGEDKEFVKIASERLARFAYQSNPLNGAGIQGMSVLQLQFMAAHVWKYIEVFPSILTLAMAKMCPSDTRATSTLLHICVEEFGGIDAISRNDLSQTHPVLFKRFLSALNIDDPDIVPALYAARKLKETYFKLIGTGIPAAILGSVGLGGECLSNKWAPFLKGLAANKYGFSSYDLEFFKVHGLADGGKDGHGEQLKQVMLDSPRLYLKSSAREILLQSAFAAIMARNDLFRLIVHYIEKKELRYLTGVMPDVTHADPPIPDDITVLEVFDFQKLRRINVEFRFVPE